MDAKVHPELVSKAQNWEGPVSQFIREVLRIDHAGYIKPFRNARKTPMDVLSMSKEQIKQLRRAGDGVANRIIETRRNWVPPTS